MHEVDTPTQSTERRRRPSPEEGPLRVVFEDDAILVLDKPAGQVVHPTYRNWSGTLLNAILWRLRERPGATPGILTRLDKGTSGLVVVGLSPATHARMQRDAAAGAIRKQYLAVVRGTPDPPHGRIVLPLGRADDDRRRVVVRADGAHAETGYELRSTREGRSLVECVLVTGRTHQIRVHLAAHGWPILGDAQYGDGSLGGGIGGDDIDRPALHAWRVTMPHPLTGETLALEAAIPDDIRRLVDPAP